MVINDDRLELILADLADHLEVAGPSVGVQARSQRGPRMVFWAAAAAALIAALILTIGPAREAVARWFGIGRTQIQLDPTTSVPLPAMAISDGLPRVSIDAAEAVVGPLPWVAGSDLGAPDGYATMPEGGVLIGWTDGTTLWVHSADLEVGMLLKKLIGADVSAKRVDDIGDEAMSVSGDHVLVTPNRTIAATTVVLWTVGDREFRLESNREVDDLIAVARDLVAG